MQKQPMLTPNLPSIDDEEGAAVPDGFPAVVDAHVHIFPLHGTGSSNGCLDPDSPMRILNGS
jgi:hypothetical protein